MQLCRVQAAAAGPHLLPPLTAPLRALCRPHSCHPAATPQEAAARNLASCYELQGAPAALATKQAWADWLAAAAPDDFDLGATKAGGLAG